MIALVKTDRLTSAKPGTWSKHYLEKGEVVLMTCPMCGKIGGLGDHSVEKDGKVKPSVVCPNENCSFHDMVKLLGWNA